MHKTQSVVRVTSAPLALAIALIAGQAFAADVDPALKGAMQRDLGMSDQQLAQYVKIERLAQQQQQALERAQGSNFAGSWIERKADGNYALVVNTTRMAPQKVVSGAEIRHVRHTLATLDGAKGRLDTALAQSAKAPAGVYGWVVDIPSNSVVISVAPQARQAALEFAAASGVDASAVRLEETGSAPRPLATLRGGSEYIASGPSGAFYCSVGFAVTQGSTRGYATAGHCGSANDSANVGGASNLTRIGTFRASNFPGTDRAWVQVNAGHTIQPTVEGYTAADVAVRGRTVASIGGAVCRSGRTTGWKCGTVQSYNATVNYPGATVNGLTRVRVCAQGGDSGGSFITSGGQAQGVLSGGNYSCQAGEAQLATSYFQPINPLLQAYGLTLTTSP